MIVGAMSVIGLIDNFIRIIAEESGVWQFYLFPAGSRILHDCFSLPCLQETEIPSATNLGGCAPVCPYGWGDFDLLRIPHYDANRGGGGHPVQLTDIPTAVFGVDVSH